jgi:hypothetical protein
MAFNSSRNITKLATQLANTALVDVFGVLKVYPNNYVSHFMHIVIHAQ